MFVNNRQNANMYDLPSHSRANPLAKKRVANETLCLQSTATSIYSIIPIFDTNEVSSLWLKKNYFEKAGSNPQLAERAVSVTLQNDWQILTKFNAGRHCPEATFPVHTMWLGC